MLSKLPPVLIVVLVIIGLFALGKLLVLAETLFGLAILIGIVWLIWKYFVKMKNK